jgi:hypothetical protein
MSIEMAFVSLGLLAAVGAVWGGWRYRHGLNPLTMYCITEIGFYTLFPGMIAYFRDNHGAGLLAEDWREEEVIQTLLLASLYAIGSMAPYLLRESLSIQLFQYGMRFAGLDSPNTASRLQLLKLAGLIVAAGGSFVCLAVVGGGGLLWLTDTREAYISCRAGAGPFFAATQWFMNVALLYTLWSLRPRLGATAVLTILFAAPLYFTGSKNSILTMIVAAGAYYHFRVQRIPAKVIFLAPVPAAAVATVALQALYGTDRSFWDGFYYFNYFSTTTMFLGRFDEFGFRQGEALLSSLWFFVPRVLYPAKPYEYGVALIHQVLFPGAAEQGHTPGILPWSMWYLDFGAIGVLAAGLFEGWIRKTAYAHFRRRQGCFFAFVMMLHFSIWPLFLYAPFLFVLVFTSGMAVYLNTDQRAGFGEVPAGLSCPAPMFLKSSEIRS